MSANNEWVFSLLMSLGHMVPMVIVWFVGLVIALVRWPRCPAVSMLVVAAIVVAGMASISTQVVYIVLPRYWDGASFAKVAGIIGFGQRFRACLRLGVYARGGFPGTRLRTVIRLPHRCGEIGDRQAVVSRSLLT